MLDTTAAPSLTAVLFGLRGCLVGHDERLSAGASQVLEHLQQQGVPCAWLDELPAHSATYLAAALPAGVVAANQLPGTMPWPLPHACWQALIELNAQSLDGGVLVSGDPLLLAAGLNAGLWTVGLASCVAFGELSTTQWRALPPQEQDSKRSKATMQLFNLGVHSVIDHLEALISCLDDIGQRRLQGEKP